MFDFFEVICISCWASVPGLGFVNLLGWVNPSPRQELNVPARTTLYRFRMLVDLASMIYSQRFVFAPQKRWTIHLRADSSPQWGKDYFVVEVDHIDQDAITDSTSFSSLSFPGLTEV